MKIHTRISEMSRSYKLGLGIIAILPALYIFGFIFFVFLLFLVIGTGNEPGSIFGLMFLCLMIVHFLMIFLSIVQYIYYIILAAKEGNVPEDKKLLWVLLIALINIPVTAVFWYIYIWNNNE